MNTVLAVFNGFGRVLTMAICLSIILFILFNIEITWPCMFCGKVNRTGFIKAFLNWCDHRGSY